MENNRAFVHCYEKILEIRLNGATYFLNLMKEGDLHDYWRYLTDLDFNEWDVNLHWDEEDDAMTTPTLTLYEVEEDGTADIFEYITIPTTILGTKDEYFNQ
jgi:hypothetical protein